MILNKWTEFFLRYKIDMDQDHLTYVITSDDRFGDPDGSPHAIAGNALDVTLRWRGDYAPIKMYNKLMAYALSNWNYRMGLDNTPHVTKPGGKGNVHIHVDLGRTMKTEMPFFFIEDNGRFVKRVEREEDIA